MGKNMSNINTKNIINIITKDYKLGFVEDYNINNKDLIIFTLVN